MTTNTAGRQYAMRFNVLHKPFDNPKIRAGRALRARPEAVPRRQCRQSGVLQALQVDVPLRLAARIDQGLGRQARGNVAKAQAAAEGGGLRRHAGRADAPDRHRPATTLATVAKPQLEAAGFKVDLQSMDWQTLVVAPHQEGRAGPGRLERLLHLVGFARRDEPGVGGVPQRLVRQGDLRLAVRRGAGEAARRLRA